MRPLIWIKADGSADEWGAWSPGNRTLDDILKKMKVPVEKAGAPGSNNWWYFCYCWKCVII